MTTTNNATTSAESETTRPRRRRGAGTIEPLADGRWRPRLPASVGRAWLEPRGSYEDAERALDAALAEIAEGHALPVEGVTLRAWGARFLDERERQGVADVASDRSRWRVHVEPSALIDLPLRALEPAHVREWVTEHATKRAAKGRGHRKAPGRRIGVQTARNTLNLFRCALEAAVERGMLDTNPARDVRLPRVVAKNRRTREPWTWLTREEQARLLATDPPRGDRDLRDLVAFAMWCGPRESEAFYLPLADVHAHDEQPHVVLRYGSPGQPTKGGTPRRVPLFGEGLEAVRRQLERLRTENRPNPHRLLWPTLRGERRQPRAPRHWPAFLAAAGIEASQRHDGRPVHWHDLRHTAATSLLAGWRGRKWSLEEIRQLLGHKDVKTTQRYAHAIAEALDSAARETDAAAREEQGSTVRSDQRLPTAGAVDSVTPRNHGAPPRRLERPTNGLGKSRDIESARELASLRGQILGFSSRGAEALEAIAAGGPGAWRRVQELLVDLIRAGEAIERKTAGEQIESGTAGAPELPSTAARGKRSA